MQMKTEQRPFEYFQQPSEELWGLTASVPWWLGNSSEGKVHRVGRFLTIGRQLSVGCNMEFLINKRCEMVCFYYFIVDFILVSGSASLYWHKTAFPGL